MPLDPKKPITKTITVDSWEFENYSSLEELITRLVACRVSGESPLVEIERDDDCYQTTISVSYQRLETDEEAAERYAEMVASKEARQRALEAAERRAYEQLKKKYGDGQANRA